MGLNVIIGSTSTPQIHSMCIPHRRNTTPTIILCLVMGDLCLSITITHTTADSQGGQEKPALQETWVGPRQQQLPHKASILQDLDWRVGNAKNTVDHQGDYCFSFIYLVWVFSLENYFTHTVNNFAAKKLMLAKQLIFE